MIKIGFDHTMEEYIALLSSSATIYMEEERLKQAYHDAVNTVNNLYWLTLLQLRIESAGGYSELYPEYIKKYLSDIGVDLSRRNARTKSGDISLDQKKVLDPLIAKGIAVELLTLYKKFKTYSSYSNSLRKLLQRGKLMPYSGDRYVRVYPTHVIAQSNLRAYYSDIAVISVPKIYSNMITGPTSNHIICWADYPQADWRFAYNMFIRNAENYETMAQCGDAYEGLARLVKGDSFDYEEFKTQRKAFKVNCLSVFYGSADTSDVASAIRQFYMSSPKYRDLLFDLSALFKLGLPIPCTSYFGYEQMLPLYGRVNQLVDKALNTPVQTMTSHVVNETVFHLLNKFWELGYTKEDINVYYVRHDEPLFLMTPRVLEDAWVFKECSEIYIPGFTPFHLDFHFGHYYQEEDAQLMSDIQRKIESSAHEYTVYSDKDYQSEIKTDYRPFPSIEYLYVQCFVTDVENKWAVVFFNYRTKKRKKFVVAAESGEDALLKVVENKLFNWIPKPQYLLLQTMGLELLRFIGDDEEVFLKIINKYDDSVSLTRLEDYGKE